MYVFLSLLLWNTTWNEAVSHPSPQRACYQNILVVLVCIVAAWRRDARR